MGFSSSGWGQESWNDLQSITTVCYFGLGLFHSDTQPLQQTENKMQSATSDEASNVTSPLQRPCRNHIEHEDAYRKHILSDYNDQTGVLIAILIHHAQVGIKGKRGGAVLLSWTLGFFHFPCKAVALMWKGFTNLQSFTEQYLVAWIAPQVFRVNLEAAGGFFLEPGSS